MEKIKICNLTKIFSPHPQRALALLDQGLSKEDIFNQTGQAVGLSGVSFDVDEGEIVVVMGLSGSGKSTLIRCINRLIDPSRGQVFIDGVDITTLDHQELLTLRRQKFGMVFQHFALFPHRSIICNVEYGLEIQGVEKEKRHGKALEALKLVGLEGWEEAFPKQLSGGMQQRVGLARALAVEPDVLLMDEAFSALDPLIRGDMQNELVLLQDRVRKTILFITHDLDEALKIGNRVVLMKDGKVVQIGTPEEIITTPSNDYVKRFVENVDHSKVLTAQAVLIKPRAVAYPDSPPQVLFDKMKEQDISCIVAINHDETLEGVIHIDALRQATERGDKTVKELIVREISGVPLKTPVSRLISILANWHSMPLPVIDHQRKLQGIVVKSAVFSVLSKQRGNQ